MQALDKAHGAGLGTHHHAVGAHLVLPVANPAQQLPPGHSGGREEGGIGVDQVLDRQHLAEVQAGLGGVALLGLVARPQPALDLAPQCRKGTGSGHRFR